MESVKGDLSLKKNSSWPLNWKKLPLGIRKGGEGMNRTY